MQAFYLFSLWSSIAIDNSLVSFVCYFFADVVLVVCNKNALTVSSIFRVQLHGGMEGCSRTGEEVKDGGIVFARLVD